VSTAGSQEPASERPDRVRLIGAALLLALVLFVAFRGPWVERLQAAWFDVHQSLWPRQVATLPVTVVAIAQKS